MVWGLWLVTLALAMKVWSSRKEKSGWMRNTDGYMVASTAWRATPPPSLEVLGLNPLGSSMAVVCTIPPSRILTLCGLGPSGVSSVRSTATPATASGRRRSAVQPQAVGDRGGLAPAGHPELGQDP